MGCILQLLSLSHPLMSFPRMKFLFPYFLQVMIIRGKDKGETGTIKRVIRSQNRVIVEGKNLVSATLFFLYMVPIIHCKYLV